MIRLVPRTHPMDPDVIAEVWVSSYALGFAAGVAVTIAAGTLILFLVGFAVVRDPSGAAVYIEVPRPRAGTSEPAR